MTPTERFLPLLIDGDTDAAAELFRGPPDVDDPFSGGRIVDHNFGWWAMVRHVWLHARDARLEPVDVIRAKGGDHVVAEAVLHLVQEGHAIALPIAVVGEEAGAQLRRLRLYHSTWPLTGRHAVRGPTILPDENLHAPDVVGEYVDALGRGDVAAILALFEPDAVVREPSGGAYTHATPEARAAFYGAILGDGGLPLLHCRLTDDGRACALEYVVDRWGARALPPQAGVAVYVRGASGSLAAARIYDDVSPPGPG